MKTNIAILAVLVFFISLSYSCKKESGDTNKPFIVILGLNPIYSAQGQPYNDEGAEAWDVTETGDTVDISNRLVVNSNVDVNTAGDYSVTYNVSDEAGNNADEKVRTVKIVIGK